MEIGTIRKKYLAYFKERGHTIIPSARLVPENDPTTLFTGSGMQPLVPYLLGAPHPQGTRLTDSQKCFRSGDIEEVGDNRHTTFFEMLGNWSLGDYNKDEQLPWFFGFLVDELGIAPERLYVTVFSGDASLDIPRDDVSVAIWQSLFAQRGITADMAVMGSEDEGAARGMQQGERIFAYDAKKNWWSRSGVPSAMPAGEPGGPDSEVFYDFGTPHDTRYGTHCHPNCDCGRFLEIGNSVFMQYLKQPDGTFGSLPKQNVDFGGGLERIAMALAETPDIIAVNHRPIITFLEERSGKRYGGDERITKAFRVVADHMKAAVFLIGDGVLPSNTDQGYFVRRLLRRAVRYADVLGVHESGLATIVEPIVLMYEEQYPTLRERADAITEAIDEEEKKFRTTLQLGLTKLAKAINLDTGEAVFDKISGKQAFDLFQSYGFPLEMTVEIARERGMDVDEAGFRTEMKHHQELSRAGSAQKFKGGLADTGEITTMLHSCTHLMLAALRTYLGDHIHQAGSNITHERTRFDFTHPEKVPRDILDKVEAYVNEAIQKKCAMTTVLMNKEDARASGVEGSFWEKYPDEVTVYQFTAPDGTVYSRELCGGPHVANTGDIKGTFRIIKEEASSAGVRRVKGVLEP